MLDSKSPKSLRSQSAMEYLMTYGWSILIITVILGALYSVGAFGSSNIGPRAPPGNCKIFRSSGEANLEGTCGGVLPQQVAQFNGQSSYVTLTGGSSITTFPANTITISAWINPTTLSGTQDIIDQRYESSYSGYEFAVSGSDLYYRYNANSVAWANIASTAGLPAANQWYQVAATYNGYFVNFYENGAPLGSTVAATGNIYSTSGYNPFIGTYASAATYFFSGSIADLQVYNTTLDANQMMALYIKGIGAAPIDPYHIVGWWPLNGNPNDYSGNNDGGSATNVLYSGSWLTGYTPP